MKKIATMSELEKEGSLLVTVDDKTLALFLVDGEPVATVPDCPHAGGPLVDGDVDGTTLTCAWHGWSFDLKSGECEEDPESPLQLFKTTRDGDDIYVSL